MPYGLTEHDISRCNLSVNEAKSLANNSRGLYTIDHFARIWNSDGKKSIRKGKSGNALGIQSNDSSLFHYEAACEAFGLRHCIEFEHELQCIGDEIEVQMLKLRADKLPSVFFVPPKLIHHPKAKLTKAEMFWCLDNPIHLKNMYFVFNLYDVSPMSNFITQVMSGEAQPGMQHALIHTLAVMGEN